ncbi:hypothetical protein BVC93_16895 [Mycobacterium sp. MS1601]|uniref:hypothetical protein n=1 Tax=Mycobacterium sp. MS1601 TaxID=1936029 RepID=UPI00097951A3|nr:hypothetical protein [Mycobacterium sp. MS1601]AQA03829.1 hypothetical protein BVC93_16895 [Mycobacterium sp. MS1601]
MATDTPAYGAGSTRTQVVSDDNDRTPSVAVSVPPRTSRAEIWARIWFVLAIGTLAYFVPLSEVGRAAFAGSQSVYLVVAPILAGLVASGYVRAPRGARDSDADWIAALLLAVGGFATLWLIEDRLPTMAALWHTDNIGLILWVAASGMVVFSARHILRMWHVWVLGLILAPVMPFMLVTAQFGGTDTAIAMTAASLGSLAVYLATRFTDMRRRLLCTVANVALSATAVLLLVDTSLYVCVIISAGAVPVVVVLAAHRLARTPAGDTSAAAASLPHRRVRSYVALVLAAGAMLWVHLPVPRSQVIESVPVDWMATTALDPVENFDFITDFVGPDATFTRYRAPGGAGEYQTVVDVISSPNLARLQDFSDAVWYPTSAPVNYQPYEGGPTAPRGMQTAHTDAETAETGDAANWNAVTWIWQSGNAFQRVTVVTSQTRGQPAPQPRPLTVQNVVIEPALWLTRQQELQAGAVDPIVTASTDVVVKRLLSNGTPHSVAVPSS